MGMEVSDDRDEVASHDKPEVRAWLDTQELAARDLWLFIETRKPTTDDDVVAATAAYLESPRSDGVAAPRCHRRGAPGVRCGHPGHRERRAMSDPTGGSDALLGRHHPARLRGGCYTDSLVRDDPERGPYSLRDRDGLRARCAQPSLACCAGNLSAPHSPQSFRNASPTRGRPRSRRIGASWQPAAHGGARRILLDAAVALFVAILAVTLWIVTDPLNLAVSVRYGDRPGARFHRHRPFGPARGGSPSGRERYTGRRLALGAHVYCATSGVAPSPPSRTIPGSRRPPCPRATRAGTGQRPRGAGNPRAASVADRKSLVGCWPPPCGGVIGASP